MPIEVGDRKLKNIILCFDGTRENFGPQPITNVLRLYQMLEREDDDAQICYYQPGIGTEASFDPVVDLRRRLTASNFSNVTDAMFASSVDHHIVSGYLFLMNHYEAGDHIFMFGFSRGAFIARALAGMLERVGLLFRGLTNMVSMAWKIYELWEYAEQPIQPNYTTTLAEEFKRTFSRSYEVRVHFQGLFDSVNSVGILRDRLFPCTQRSAIVDHVRHAVSLDERKGKFKVQSFAPTPYYEKNDRFMNYKYYDNFSRNYSSALSAEDIIGDQAIPGQSFYKSTTPSRKVSMSALIRQCGNDEQNEEYTGLTESDFLARVNEFLENVEECRSDQRKEASKRLFESPQSGPPANSGSSESILTPDLVEKWFPGDHSDIGGGWGTDCLTKDSLSNLSLRWMITQGIDHGVIFKKEALQEFFEKSSAIGSLVSSLHDKLSFNRGIKLGPLRDEDVIINSACGLSDHSSRKNSGRNFHLMLREFFSTKRAETRSENELVRDRYTSLCQGINKLQTFLWWCLELIPIGLRIENENGKWKNVYLPNLGRPRYVPAYADLHWSVFWRIKHDARYRPKNLPAYARKLLDEFEDIKIEDPRLTNLETLTSPFKSYPSLPETSCLLENQNNLANEDPKPAAAAAQYSKNRKKLLQWEAEHWGNVPDELTRLFSRHRA